MEKCKLSKKGMQVGKRGKIGLAVLSAVACFGGYGGSAVAFEIPTGNRDVSLRWDNTLRYSLTQRLKGQNQDIINSPNVDDGDRNFDVGIVSNRLDLLSEADLVYKKDYGIRFSGTLWYDQAYKDGLDNSSAATSNHIVNGQPQTGLNSYTRRYYAGPSGELLDAFVFGKYTIADIPISVKVGRHTIYWGEAMLSNGGLHGINYGQSAIDVSKAFSQPGVELKELFRPKNQVSVQVQPTDELTISGQYYLQWEANRFPEPGTYLSFSDVLGTGGSESLVAGPPFHSRVFNGGDIEPDQAKDYGVAVRWSPSGLAGTVGFYYRSFSDVFGQMHLNLGAIPVPGAPPGTVAVVPTSYHWAYASDIKLYGISLSKQVAGISIGSEISYRTNMPLWSDAAVIVPGGSLPGRGDTFGARGEILNALANFLYIFNNSPLFDTATVLSEFTWNHMVKVTDHPELYKGRSGYTAIDKSDKDSFTGALNFTPTWYQVIPGVDLNMPLSISMGLGGNSAVTAGGNQGTGQYGGGLGVDVFQKYKVDLRYSSFFGRIENSAAGIVANGAAAALKDRDMISLVFKTNF